MKNLSVRNENFDIPRMSDIETSKNAETATKLQTARTINGVEFDGTKNISVSSIPAKSLTGEIDLNDLRTTNGIGVWTVDSAYQTVLNKPIAGEVRGTLVDRNFALKCWGIQYFFPYNNYSVYMRYYQLGTNNNIDFLEWKQFTNNNGSCLSAVKLSTARNISIGGVSKSFDGSSDISFTAVLVASVVQGNISGLTNTRGNYYVPNNSKATKALVEIWGDVSISSAASASVYGSRYISSITATSQSTVISGPSAFISIGVDSTGRPYFSGGIGANYTYRVTWYL